MLNDAPAPRTLEDALALLEVVCAELVALRAENAQLQARVRELEARLGQNSTNSSRPPSSDPPARPPRPLAPPTGRRRGGQPGHPPHQRALVPPEQVDTVVPHRPTHCRGCQARRWCAPGTAYVAQQEASAPVRQQAQKQTHTPEPSEVTDVP